MYISYVIGLAKTLKLQGLIFCENLDIIGRGVTKAWLPRLCHWASLWGTQKGMNFYFRKLDSTAFNGQKFIGDIEEPDLTTVDGKKLKIT